jgi:hypothetical protein
MHGKVLVVLTISMRLKRGARKDDHGRKGDQDKSGFIRVGQAAGQRDQGLSSDGYSRDSFYDSKNFTTEVER